MTVSCGGVAALQLSLHVLRYNLDFVTWTGTCDVLCIHYTGCTNQKRPGLSLLDLGQSSACKLVGWLGWSGMSVSSWPASGLRVAELLRDPDRRKRSQVKTGELTEHVSPDECLFQSPGQGLCQLSTKQPAPIFTCHWCLLCISPVFSPRTTKNPPENPGAWNKKGRFQENVFLIRWTMMHAMQMRHAVDRGAWWCVVRVIAGDQLTPVPDA